MIIPINIAIPGPSSVRQLPPQFAQFGTGEVVLVELQGALEVDGDLKDQVVGKLSVDIETKKPSLRIGHHLLEGKLVTLPKPLAVMHRAKVAVSTTEGDAMDDSDQTLDSSPPQWDIIAVVKRKMVFAKRPMPMVGRVLPTAPVDIPSSGLE
ncbi:hypothetical protein PHLCEN_2v1817 [Hermanssonia centrifuga]|uniref:Chromosome transmission fidelity protein 8 n=1 Tax=Hermanssonia centrifuga TaxID=98765 RepID=A0A2R6RVV9_9APHY|nr:hypothetical protein PHLCEN_2v1817 [Hermanssonia centrifuga]